MSALNEKYIDNQPIYHKSKAVRQEQTAQKDKFLSTLKKNNIKKKYKISVDNVSER